MKIVYATDNYWPRMSGIAVSIDTFRRELSRMGHEVHVVAPEYPGHQEQALRDQRDHVHRLRSFPAIFSAEDRLPRLGEKRRLFEVLDALKPDVIHSQTEWTMGRLAWKYAQARGVPLVMSAQTYFEQYIHHYAPFVPQPVVRWITRWYSRAFFNRANALVVPSSHMRSVLVDYGVSQPTTVIPTGFERARFEGVDRERERRESFLFERYPQLKGRKIVLTVCRLGREKNLDFLLDAFERVAAQVSDAMWLLVGDGPAKQELQEKIRERGLEGRVVMTGYVPRERIKHVFGLADVFAFSSKTETQGLVTVEAMSCGAPVVALGEMGTRDVMAGDNGGFMVREDAELFAARVTELLTNPRLHQRKAEEAVRYARRWSAGALAEKMLRLYEVVVDLKREVPQHVEALIDAAMPQRLASGER